MLTGIYNGKNGVSLLQADKRYSDILTAITGIGKDLVIPDMSPTCPKPIAISMFGEHNQATGTYTKYTYTCAGTESGAYYITISAVNYIFTMPTVVNGDKLIFDTYDAKLWLNAIGGAEIATTTGTPTTETDLTASLTSATYTTPCPEHQHAVIGKDNPTLTFKGKNMLPNTSVNNTRYGVTFTVNSDKSIIINGIASTALNQYICGDGTAQNIFYLPAGTYALSKGFTLSGADIVAVTNEATPQGLYGVFTLTTGAWIKYVYINIPSGAAFYNTVAYPQLEPGTVATAYQQYTAPQSVTLNEANTGISGGVLMGGIKQDAAATTYTYIDAAGNKWIANSIESGGTTVKYKPRITKLILTGTELWSKNSLEETNRTYYLAAPHQKIAGYCTHFTHGSSANSFSNQFNSTYSANSIYISYANNPANDVTAFKAWLAAQYAAGTPVCVDYIPNSFTETDITATAAGQALLAMYGASPVTLVTCDCNTQITYNRRIQALKENAVEKTGYGVVSGLSVTAQTVPNMTVNAATGVMYMANGDRFAPYANAALAITAADATNPRIDIVYVNSVGVISYLAGTPAASPVAPTVPAGGQLLYEIAVAAGATSITAANITDKRRMLTSGEAWITPTLLYSWVTSSAAYTVRYCKDATNDVHLDGMVKGGTLYNPIYRLPVGYRPLKDLYIPVVCNGAIGQVVIQTNGDVLPTHGSTAQFSLAGIIFRAEQ